MNSIQLQAATVAGTLPCMPDHPRLVCVLGAALTLLAGPFSAQGASDPAAEIQALKDKKLALQTQAKTREALRLAGEILTKTRTAYPNDPGKVLEPLADLAYAQQAVGDFKGAQASCEEAIVVSERVSGPKNLRTIMLIEQLASIHFGQWDVEGVKRTYTRALQLRAETQGKNGSYGTYLSIYASFLVALRLLGEAQPLYLEAIRLIEADQGPDSAHLVGPLMMLGQLYGSTGYHALSRELNARTLALHEKIYGPDSEHLLATLSFMALQLAQVPDLARAQPLADRMQTITERVLEEARATQDLDREAVALHNLAEVRLQLGRPAEAKGLLEQSIAAYQKQHGPRDFRLHAGLARLVEALRRLSDYPKALEVATRLHALERDKQGDSPFSLSTTIMAMLLREMGRNDEAAAHFERQLASSVKFYGERHLVVGALMEGLGGIHLARKDLEKALGLFEQGRRVLDAQEDAIFASGDEANARGLLHMSGYRLHMYASLHLDHALQSPRAMHFALDTLLRRKGRDLDAVSQQNAALRRQLGPKERETLDGLNALRSRMAKLGLESGGPGGGDGPARELARLDEEARRLESELRKSSAAYRAGAPEVSVEAIHKAIPADAALIEIVRYRPFQPTAVQERLLSDRYRFAAYVLRPGVAPQAIPLGEAEPIDRSIMAWREALANPDRADVDRLGRDVYGRVMKPLAPALAGTKHLILSPDGGLQLVPFAAMPDDNGVPLVRRFTVSYVTSGRDLLRFAFRFDPRQGTVIIADPIFDGVPAGPAKGRGARSAAFKAIRWEPLPGTGEEAAALQAELQDARLFTREAATEAALKAIQAPRILHVATHGFFLPAEREDRPDGPGRGLVMAPGEMGGTENPLLRSGLVLAGANALASGGDDGVLTALEATGLDLVGTKLVVLSACETGVGEMRPEQGVYGLRRSLVIAGAESMVMSLWQVDDAATRDLMIAYYKELKAGTGRAEALRKVQVKMAGSAEFAHPYYWASFIPVGQWSPIE
jgi:CHAT domain-containing protein